MKDTVSLGTKLEIAACCLYTLYLIKTRNLFANEPSVEIMFSIAFVFFIVFDTIAMAFDFYDLHKSHKDIKTKRQKNEKNNL